MTEAELWEIFFEASSVATSVFSVVLTVNFAYLATAYFVGTRLSTFQTLVVSFLYVFGAGILTMSFAGMLNRGLEFGVDLHPKVTHGARVFASKTDPRVTLPPAAGRRELIRSDRRGFIECDSALAPS